MASRGYPNGGGYPAQVSGRGGYPNASNRGRGGYGSGGNRVPDNFVPPGPLTARVNLFEITNLPSISYFQYSVEFMKPQTKNRNRCAEIIDRLQNHTAPDLFVTPAIFDGRSALYVAGRPLNIPDTSRTFHVRMSDTSDKEYIVRLSLDDPHGVDVSLLNKSICKSFSQAHPDIRHSNEQNSLRPMNIINLLVRAAPSLTAIGQGMDVHQVRAARLYVTDVGKRDISGGLEMWQGYFQSARPAIGRVLLNIDTATATMISPGRLQDVAMSYLGLHQYRDLHKMQRGDTHFRLLESFLKRVFVLVDMNSISRPPKNDSRKKQIIGIKSSRELDTWTFLKDGQPMTVKVYYKTIYNKDLKSPFAIMCGNREAPTVFPAEFCWITPGQLYKKKLSRDQTTAALTYTTKSPAARLKAIEDGIGAGNVAALKAPIFEYQSSPVIAASGMTVSTRTLEIHGRILETPRVQFGNNSVTPRNGAWNVKDQKVMQPTKMLERQATWAMVDLADTDPRKGQDFTQQLKLCLSARGIANSDPVIKSGNPLRIPKFIEDAKNYKATFLLIILPDVAEDIRNSAKYYGDIKFGIPTQCVTRSKVEKANDQYCNNLVLKINGRLNGINSHPETEALKRMSKKPFMIFGMDVSHPPPGVKNMPSIAGVVASMNHLSTKYEAQSRVQDPTVEIIVDLGSMVRSLMDSFLAVNKALPMQLIFFRDGVSEGQFSEVCQRELGVIDQVIHSYQAGYMGQKCGKPKVTFVVVRKRHHIRFFPLNGKGADGKGNVQAGFLADKGIESPFYRDFYLLSHGGLLGTSRPSYYTVLHDECFNKETTELQELAYALCHCYAAATRSVSIPAPIYYADKVCSRSKFHYAPNSDLQSLASEDEFNLSYWQGLYEQPHPIIQKSMYFV